MNIKKASIGSIFCTVVFASSLSGLNAAEKKPKDSEQKSTVPKPALVVSIQTDCGSIQYWENAGKISVAELKAVRDILSALFNGGRIVLDFKGGESAYPGSDTKHQGPAPEALKKILSDKVFVKRAGDNLKKLVGELAEGKRGLGEKIDKELKASFGIEQNLTGLHTDENCHVGGDLGAYYPKY